jgi:hypothetical protein
VQHAGWILFALVVGCSEDSSSGGTCVPGEQKSCPCAGSGSGAQTCNKDGTGFDACFGCGTGGSAGGGGSGGQSGGGSGGGAGASTGKRSGIVKLDQSSLSDDQGAFNALGATMMWGAWAYKNDRPRLEQNLAYLSEHGYHYVRALGVVGDPNGEDFWDGREIDWHWPDYADVIAGFTDLAYDQYGLRIEWTLIGDGQLNIPDPADRQALVDTFVAMSAGREQKIMHFEIANEAWQNGFDGAPGTAELRALSQYMKDKTEILVAASAPPAGDCGGAQEIYAGGVADLATIHFDRDVGQIAGHWRPVHQPWWVWHCSPALPVASNNEPIGPGSSVNTEDDPQKLSAGALASWVSGLPLHVFHSNAGVRGDANLFEMAGVDAFANLGTFVPNDLASWQKHDRQAGDAPFRVYAEGASGSTPDAVWPEVASPTAGVVEALSATKGSELFVLLVGILDHVQLEARTAVTFDVLSVTGSVLSSHTLGMGESVTLNGAEAVVLRGTKGR